MKLLYFSWVRERVGTIFEELHPPAHIDNVEKLIKWLCEQGEQYEAAFADMSSVRIAINQEHTKLDAAVKSEDEIAFFPPVTGG